MSAEKSSKPKFITSGRLASMAGSTRPTVNALLKSGAIESEEVEGENGRITRVIPRESAERAVRNWESIRAPTGRPRKSS